MEAEFLLLHHHHHPPSESEATAASALLLLSSKLPESFGFLSSTIPPPPPLLSSSYLIDDSNIKRKTKKNSDDDDDSIEFSSPTDSKSCSSSLTSESCSSEESLPDRLSILALAAHLHDIKLKWQVVRRHRSKHYRISDRRKNLWNEWKKPLVLSQVSVPVKQTRSQVFSSESSWRIRSEVSSFSSESSSSSTTTTTLVSEEMAPSRRMMMRSVLGTVSKWEMMRRLQKNYRISSGRMRRRAEAILKLLSVGCASEVKIRQVLGDSPDTSKALRILLKLEEVKRSGAGGPKDPFLYTAIGGSGSDVESALSDS